MYCLPKDRKNTGLLSGYIVGKSNSYSFSVIKQRSDLLSQPLLWKPRVSRRKITIVKVYSLSQPLKKKTIKTWNEAKWERGALFFQHWPILFRSNNSKAAESLKHDCKTITLLNYFLLARQANLLFDNASCSKIVNFIIQRSWEKDHRYSLLTSTR